MRHYRECQQNLWCPDKLGHLFLFLFLSYVSISYLGMIISIILLVLLGVGIELGEWFVYRRRVFGFLHWLSPRDSRLDLLVDLLGIILGFLLYVLYPRGGWVVVTPSLFLSWWFGRFVSWEEYRNLKWKKIY